ncbi:hypothetical protein [Sporosarcina koreensis]|uniref:hypothetical protein n=1 Tax=Sporosarcina koreensis TaxID=334735 RepID=UPI00075C6558|nr:hypothetical protein [Sporosarcina koreensis]
MNWSQLIIGLLPLLGVAVGGYATYFTQSKTLNRQLDRDKEKEKEAKNIERLTVYGEILKLDGENSMSKKSLMKDFEEFNLATFITEFRPIFFSKFFLLDQDVAELVRKMDSVLIGERESIYLSPRQNTLLLESYNQIINSIEIHLENYRKKL